MEAGSPRFPSRYERARRIAVGGMGEIYIAEDRTLGRTVAIKQLAERFARDEAVRRRFTREGLTAARLSGHPHIVTIFDVGESEGRPFIVMEHVPGGTLAERARGGDLPPEQAIRWLADAASALDEAHRQGIVHRDVKPANLLLDERDRVHVADFGIARIADETTSGMTIAGTILGTAGYLAPEQARGEPATPASDVYALGVVAYELLTGGRPFEGGSATEEAAAHIHQPVPPASSRGVGVPATVDPVLERALAKEPGERYETTSELVQDLERALEEGDRTRVLPAAVPAGQTAATRRLTDARAAPTAGPPPDDRRRRWWVALAAALALAAAAIGGVVLAATLAGEDEAPVAETPTEPDTVEVEVTVTDEQPGTTVIETETVTVEEPGNEGQDGQQPNGAVSMAQARQLTDQATAAMRQGDYEEALALAERALERLTGTGDIYEAYASYNAGNSLAELGDCDRALPLLDRSEAIQGQRREIDEARAKCD